MAATQTAIGNGVEAPGSVSGKPPTRYQLIVNRAAAGGVGLRVLDLRTGYWLFEWDGFIARYVIEHGGLCRDLRAVGCHDCDKCLVWHLAMIAAAGKTLLARLGGLSSGAGASGHDNELATATLVD